MRKTTEETDVKLLLFIFLVIIVPIIGMITISIRQIKECKEDKGVLVKGVSGWGTGYICIESKEVVRTNQ